MKHDIIQQAVEGIEFLRKLGEEPQGIVLGTEDYAQACAAHLVLAESSVVPNLFLGLPLFVDPKRRWCVDFILSSNA